MYKIALLILVAVLAFTAGWLIRPQRRVSTTTKVAWQLADAIPPATYRNCVAPNQLEQQAFELALSALEVSGSDREIGWLDIGAEKFLGDPLFRRDGKSAVPVCPPEGVYARAEKAISDDHLFSRGRLEEYQLKLASKLPHPSSYIVDAVANSAFNESPQESEIFRFQDIRPLARTVLAGFGMEAEEYRDKAFQQMSANDSLGTGAAQIAVATGHPDALPRAEAMMERILSSVPTDKAVPFKSRKRLDELTYAIAFGGAEGKRYTAPIRDLMTRKVENWAPPFGMVELRPTEMCDLLKRIEGPDAAANYSYCVARTPSSNR